MIKAAANLLSRTPPIAVRLGQILYHPEAIMLAVKPARALTPVRDAVQAATQLVTSKSPDADTSRWTPHVTISYSTSAKAADPIITALGPQLPGCEIKVSAVSLVIQHGPERRWDWQTIGTVHLPASTST
jgi:2'-5' RNA ligase